MKKKTIVFVTVAVFMTLLLSFFVGSGFQKRTDVALYDYSLSENGKELTFFAHVSSSMGYIRGFADKGGGVKPT